MNKTHIANRAASLPQSFCKTLSKKTTLTGYRTLEHFVCDYVCMRSDIGKEQQKKKEKKLHETFEPGTMRKLNNCLWRILCAPLANNNPNCDASCAIICSCAACHAMDLVCMRSPEVATLRWPIAGGFVNAALCVTTRKRPMSHTQHIHTRTQAHTFTSHFHCRQPSTADGRNAGNPTHNVYISTHLSRPSRSAQCCPD